MNNFISISTNRNNAELIYEYMNSSEAEKNKSYALVKVVHKEKESLVQFKAKQTEISQEDMFHLGYLSGLVMGLK